ncbi:MAG: UDP-N-acetylmuramoyl-L-alanyl-D-glutamate--2,6-diaminopimelate ligase [Deltaproteobacteria bacterium]|nr:UDP-N-acetylmuramoyl-L-alanyl-D-glutamate--2,6-diaminopimelate ligase [Deltaproteobacteria bacterium]
MLSGLREPPSALRGDANVDVSSLTTDSRRVLPGALFFALPGTRTDGSRFVGEAIERGAVAVAAEKLPATSPATCLSFPSILRALSEISARFHGHPSRKLCLVGITGTNGKTTITHLLESIWASAGHRPGIVGTIRYRVGERSWPAPFTTPQAPELQRLLAEMVEAGATHVAMEVSSHALALERARDCDWDGALFSNLTRDHLDFHPDMESYFAAKRSLFTDLLPRSAKPRRFAVVNRDDPYGRRLAGEIGERLITFGRGDDADVAPVEVERSLEGLRGEIRVGQERVAIASPLVGDAHLENILAAAAAAWAQGIPLPTIAEGVRRCRGIPGRMERVDQGAPFAVLVDYAHSPDALERAMRLLRSVAEGRVIVVFGCGGDRDRGKRPLMGEAAGRIADLVIVTSDNPRTEDPLRIIHDVERGVIEAGLGGIQEGAVRRAEASGYLLVPERKRAIRLAIEIARPTDVVLIAGKGHETDQIVGAERHPFDDREEARRSLREVVGS